MSTKHNTQSDNKQPPTQPLFEPFPEPQTYPKRWDGIALEELSRPKTGKSKSKPQV
ncbi:MAG: hypothetical protein JXA10_07115 [Anaerolineae bacterium]|nr:hypothetical protein [Anaerolineae bacterium]